MLVRAPLFCHVLQVLFLNPGIQEIMGYLIQRRRSNVVGTEQRYTNLLLCVQEMPKERSTNSCYTAGVVKLDQGDELELVIPDRPNAKISMDADSTFLALYNSCKLLWIR
ncbi:tumor necrosis factor ligand superfamily member 13B-like isoform X2 [Acipenser oxyrinchus oxyrinchus]|uniref:Tumor necrosis factor ligand superfamily member 13B-like isoform X2 n=1 Tax=Acipenser oxyrinchus oxyrinchus TaxID=40147 RepID=A0AAD8CF53_ACIOX|nr:tumor necrosis factor ligand superfamily member 13B-like isoform X2 [Acipenser oxyrinchus oxyrinchus]